MSNEIVYNLKRILFGLLRRVKDFLISKLICIGILLSAWVIFSIEIPLIPKIQTCLTKFVAAGLNRVFLALAYSYVAGVIIYWLTVRYPYLRNKRKLSLVIKTKIGNIGTHLMNMNLEFRKPDNNPPITDVDAVMAMFTIKKWREKCCMPEHAGCRDVTEGYIQDYCELQTIISFLINDYKDYLSADQLFMLELLRGNRVNQFFSTAKKCNGRYEFTDAFYEKVLQPSYRTMLEVYNKLVLL